MRDAGVNLPNPWASCFMPFSPPSFLVHGFVLKDHRTHGLCAIMLDLLCTGFTSDLVTFEHRGHKKLFAGIAHALLCTPQANEILHPARCFERSIQKTIARLYLPLVYLLLSRVFFYVLRSKSLPITHGCCANKLDLK